MTDEALFGNKAIAAVLGVADEDTVSAWAALPWDPLPLRDWMGGTRAWAPFVREWQARRADLAAWRTALTAWRARMPVHPTDRWLELNPQPQPTLPIWVEWEEIAAAFPTDRSVDTAQRAAEPRTDPLYRPLPVVGAHRPDERLIRPGGGHRRVWIYRSALRDWIDSRDRPHVSGQTRGRRVADSGQLSLFA